MTGGYSSRESSAIARRVRRASESFGNAAAALGPITAGCAVFTITRGQWSMVDAIHHCLNELGPSHVSVWTWAIASYEVESLGGLVARGDLLSCRLIVDYSAGRRNIEILDWWRAKFGPDQVRVCKNHAKLARVWQDDGLRVLVRGSANLNFNPRFEQIDLSEGGAEFDLVTRIEDGLPVLPREHSHAEALSATGLGGAFDLATLAKFGPAPESEVKPWRP